MKRSFFKIIYALVLFIFGLNTFNNKGVVERLKGEYPEIKEVAESLPIAVQQKLAAPTELPFKPINVALTYAGDMPGKPMRDIIHTEFTYGDGEGVNLRVITFHNKKAIWSDEKQTNWINLKDGTKAFIEGDAENVQQIRWKKDGIYYSIMLIKSPEIEKEYSIEDVVKTANSMEY
ncbi:hypothetical protein [Fictibacillus barbaricus]|uniref:DUF4367 domain-containing protein n=1 Tax=Fictibacillus barbaricus TaxID=182136 RepID=A0ABS2ZC68_9BACL|nr:hypothetical protein [Fictibacillus barbaricus]MBN3545031.1 hypothetical protein [Fictibacillus barbaricus]GGB62257.1 hypothetical protein GCM10007199_30220 [Fictibacillus barbaricus]